MAEKEVNAKLLGVCKFTLNQIDALVKAIHLAEESSEDGR